MSEPHTGEPTFVRQGRPRPPPLTLIPSHVLQNTVPPAKAHRSPSSLSQAEDFSSGSDLGLTPPTATIEESVMSRTAFGHNSSIIRNERPLARQDATSRGSGDITPSNVQRGSSKSLSSSWLLKQPGNSCSTTDTTITANYGPATEAPFGFGRGETFSFTPRSMSTRSDLQQLVQVQNKVLQNIEATSSAGSEHNAQASSVSDEKEVVFSVVRQSEIPLPQASRSNPDTIVADKLDDGPHYIDLHPELKGVKLPVFKQKCHPRSFRVILAQGVERMEEAFTGAKALIRSVNPSLFSIPYGSRVINLKTDRVENLQKALQCNRWSTLDKVAERIMTEYRSQIARKERTFFLVAVNGGKSFCALAEMSGPWDSSRDILGWHGPAKGSFPVTWIFVKNVAYGHFMNIKQDRNDQPVVNMWNGMAIDWETGHKAVEVYASAVHFSNVLCWPKSSGPMVSHATDSDRGQRTASEWIKRPSLRSRKSDYVDKHHASYDGVTNERSKVGSLSSSSTEVLSDIAMQPSTATSATPAQSLSRATFKEVPLSSQASVELGDRAMQHPPKSKALPIPTSKAHNSRPHRSMHVLDHDGRADPFSWQTMGMVDAYGRQDYLDMQRTQVGSPLAGGQVFHAEKELASGVPMHGSFWQGQNTFNLMPSTDPFRDDVSTNRWKPLTLDTNGFQGQVPPMTPASSFPSHGDLHIGCNEMHAGSEYDASDVSYPSIMRDTDSMAGYTPNDSTRSNNKRSASPFREVLTMNEQHMHTDASLHNWLDRTPTMSSHIDYNAVKDSTSEASQLEHAEFLRMLADKIELDAKIEAFRSRGFGGTAHTGHYAIPPVSLTARTGTRSPAIPYVAPSIATTHGFDFRPTTAP